MNRIGCLLTLTLAVLPACVEEPDAAAPGGRLPLDAQPERDVRPVNDGFVEPRDVALPMDASRRADTAAPDAVVDPVIDGPDAVPADDVGSAMDAGTDVGVRPMIDDCFGMLLDGAPFIADYAAFDALLGRHCRGTDHQEIAAVQQVVFIGDALMTGRSRFQSDLPLRVRLASRLSQRFGLQAPDVGWHSLDPLTGQPELRRSGDFIACADPLAEVADLLDGQRLLVDCLLPEEYGRRTLFIITVGIRDVQRLTEMLADGADDAQVFSAAGQSVDALDQAVRWMMDPARFPAGSFVVLSNVPDWTDGRGDTAACQGWPPLPVERQGFFGHMMAHINGQYMRVAVERGADLGFMQEHFCGHGIHFRRPDPLCLGMPERWVQRDCRFLNAEGDTELGGLLWDVITDAE